MAVIVSGWAGRWGQGGKLEEAPPSMAKPKLPTSVPEIVELLKRFNERATKLEWMDHSADI